MLGVLQKTVQSLLCEIRKCLLETKNLLNYTKRLYKKLYPASER
jgi:hypothetical protein